MIKIDIYYIMYWLLDKLILPNICRIHQAYNNTISAPYHPHGLDMLIL